MFAFKPKQRKIKGACVRVRFMQTEREGKVLANFCLFMWILMDFM